MDNTHKKLERLMLFSEVAKQLSFTKAAQALGLSKGYLSQQVKQLESEFKTPLLIRSTRAVKVTEGGKALLAHAEEIKQSMLSVERILRSERDQVSGNIRITAPKLLAQSVVADICQAFKADYPQVTFTLDSSYQQYDLTAADFDLAFRATSTPPENMIAKQLFRYRHICVASPEYLARTGAPKSIEELTKHQILAAPHDSYWPLDGQQIGIQAWLVSNDNNLLLSQALQGCGIARLPDYAVKSALNDGYLCEILETVEKPSHNIYLLQPQLIYPPQKVTLFAQFVLAYLKQTSFAGLHIGKQ